MLSHGLWERRFASDPGIVGHSINLDGNLCTIVGVLPATFDFGNIFAPGLHADLFSPFPLNDRTNRWGNTMAVIGRLETGSNHRGRAGGDDALAGPMRRDHPNWNGFIPQLSSLSQRVSGTIRPALILLSCAVGVVMLIVCANLSNLLLARGASRQKEIAIRSALGATKRTADPPDAHREYRPFPCRRCARTASRFRGDARALSHLSGMTIPLLEDVHVDLTFPALHRGCGDCHRRVFRACARIARSGRKASRFAEGCRTAVQARAANTHGFETRWWFPRSRSPAC